MQYRRHGGYVREPRSMKLHGQDQLHLDPRRYCNPRRETLDRSPRHRRSLSPYRIDASRREVGFSQWNENIERKEGDWHLRSRRNIDDRTKSPSYDGQASKRSYFEEAFLDKDHRQPSESQQIRGLHESRNLPARDEVLDYKHDHRYRHDDLNVRKEKEVIEGRWSDGSGQRIAAQKSLGIKDGAAIRSRSSCLDMGPMSIYEDYSPFLPSSRSSNVAGLDDERLKFQKSLVSDKSEVKESHKVEDRHMFNSKNDAYSASSGFDSRKYAGSSSGSLTRKRLESYLDGHYFQVSDEFSRSHGDLKDPERFASYGKSVPVDSSTMDIGAGKLNLTHHKEGANREHGDYFYSKSDGPVNGSHAYPSELNQRHNYIDYDSAVGSDHGDFLRPKVASTGLMKIQHADDLSADYRTGTTYKHYSLQKQTVLDYPDVGQTTKALKHDSEYAGMRYSQVEVGKGVFQDYEISHTNPSHYCQTMHARSCYDYEREAGPEFLKERLRRSPMVKCDEEAYINTEGVQTEGVGTYSMRDQKLKRKYYEEDTSLLDHRIGMPREYLPGEAVDLYDNDEEWVGDDISGRNTVRESVFDHSKHRKSNKKHDRNERHVSDYLFSGERYLGNGQKYKNGPRYMKDSRTHGGPSWIRSQKYDARNSLRKQHNAWKKTEVDNNRVHMNDDNLSDDSVAGTESEPSESSEEFKQKVHEAFLKYSKKLNMKPSVRKRYKEQGNAGSLYCIICGISFSKEYKGTRRLVKHAYRSDKVGLRAKHLGFGKAVCTLIGWNSVIPQDITTWVPEVLPEAGSLVQKEDLIMWPPLIVVRNISVQSNRDNSRVVTIEALESFLRGKGLLKGRVRGYWGRPVDKSVIVLKFLPTFSGLNDAERLHNYFLERSHGRLDFKVAKRNNGKSSKGGGEGVENEGDEMKEKILYGYMGIAEDLDEVDLNTKKLSLIKSKKEILEL